MEGNIPVLRNGDLRSGCSMKTALGANLISARLWGNTRRKGAVPQILCLEFLVGNNRTSVLGDAGRTDLQDNLGCVLQAYVDPCQRIVANQLLDLILVRRGAKDSKVHTPGCACHHHSRYARPSADTPLNLAMEFLSQWDEMHSAPD